MDKKTYKALERIVLALKELDINRFEIGGVGPGDVWQVDGWLQEIAKDYHGPDATE